MRLSLWYLHLPHRPLRALFRFVCLVSAAALALHLFLVLRPPCPAGHLVAPKSALILDSFFNSSNTSYYVEQFGGLLQRLGVEVDVAFPSNAALAHVCQRHNFTAVPLPADRAAHGRAARSLHTIRRYSLLIWLTDDFIRMLPYVNPLPSASSLLWAHGSAVFSENSRRTNMEPLLKFDYVWFTNIMALRTASRFVNPMGHRPPSFQLAGPALPSDWLAPFLSDLVTPASLSSVPTIGTANASHPSPRSGVHSLGPARVPDACPRKKPARLAIALHLAARPVAWLRPVFHAMHALRPTPAHLWLTVWGSANLPAVLRAATEANVVCHPLAVRNKGMDVGPFFLVLWQIFTCRYSYDYILKFHFKTSEESFMSRHAAMYFYYPNFLQTAIATLDRHPNYSAVYPTISTDDPVMMSNDEYLFLGANGDNMRELSAVLRLWPWPKSFLVGTVFLTRMEVFARWLGNPDTLWRFYQQLNDIDGLDWRWYNHYYFGDRCGRPAVEWHYRHHLGTHRYYGDVYAIPDYLGLDRDGMLVHSWERLLSFMVSARGALVPLPVPYACHPPHRCPSMRGRWGPNLIIQSDFPT